MMPQLAKTLKDPSKLKFPVIVEEKLDGMRVLINLKEQKAYSRNMKEFTALQPLATAVWHNLKGNDIDVYSDEWEWIDGEYGREWKKAAHARQKEPIPLEELEVFTIFDIPKHPGTQEERRDILEGLSLIKPLRLSRSWKASSWEDVVTIYDKVLSEGLEGIMIKDPRGRYSWDKRTSSWLKYKPSETIDARVVRCIEGTNRLTGTLGAIELEIFKKGEPLIFHVGTGFTDSLRDELWEKRESLPGRIIEVKVQKGWEKIGSPRFPVFSRFRDEKTEPDRF